VSTGQRTAPQESAREGKERETSQERSRDDWSIKISSKAKSPAQAARTPDRRPVRLPNQADDVDITVSVPRLPAKQCLHDARSQQGVSAEREHETEEVCVEWRYIVRVRAQGEVASRDAMCQLSVNGGVILTGGIGPEGDDCRAARRERADSPIRQR
jgi:hypothetical protein